MIAEPLGRVLEATGYLENGAGAAATVTVAPSASPGADAAERNGAGAVAPVTLAGSGGHARLPSFDPDVWWRSDPDADRPGVGGVGLSVYFKYVDEPRDAAVAEWQREIWNRGFSPLLWLVSPERIDLYNGFGVPGGPDKAEANRLDTFLLVDAELTRLDTLAGRLAMETGQFWRLEPRVNRDTSVDRRLLRDLDRLESVLTDAELEQGEAQALIGRCIFAKYLTDREIVGARRLKKLCGHADLADVLEDPTAAERLFEWLQETFNGDMFPPSSEPAPVPAHLEQVARFLNGEDLETGQRSFFPYRFDVIPVELVSAIYEQFVHSATATASDGNNAKKEGVYYTPLTAVSLVLDEVFDGLTGDETVLDLTCGSGVFLVEALRRLVRLKSNGGTPTRATIREALYSQVYGVDISEAAVRIAAFSLYLAALELEPDPRPSRALRFKPLQGKTLLVGDALTIEETPDGRTVMADGRALKRFDVIVGNPPWSYKGKAGTAARRAAGSLAPLQPRGQSLDFVARARDFAHDKTRFGMILSAMPFFGRSSTTIAAARDSIEGLAPVTLVNLSDLTGWLFPKAGMPAIALLARHRRQSGDRMTLVRTHWSRAGERSHTIEVAPSDVTTLPIASWQRNPGLFKAAFLGRRPDLLLLDHLWDKHRPLETRLAEEGVTFTTGLILGNRRRDAAFLRGLPVVDGRLKPPFPLFGDDLPRFDQPGAERPRQREVYRAPLVLVRQFMHGGPRPLVRVGEQDVVFTDAWYGASFAGVGAEAAYLVAGILGSALASWHFLMTGSSFGVWARRLKLKDVVALPAPALKEHVGLKEGRRVAELVRALDRLPPDAGDWGEVDDAVFDLYELGDADRIIVRDGLFRAGWQWKVGRERSVVPADLDDLRGYAQAFLGMMDAWLSASNRRRMRAEIYDLASDAPHRVIRFVLEDRRCPSVVEIVRPDGPLRAVLERIGERTEARIAEALVGLRDLRVHGRDEVSIIKPAARRNWSGVCGLEDADLVVRDSAHGGGRT